MSQENRHFYEFGPFRIDTRNRQLLRENEVVPLKAKAVDTTHSESLEFIAKAFGFDNWNILSAKIDAAERRAGADRARSSTDGPASAPQRTLYCSFCGKSQHDVRTLVAGPAVFICDACIDVCTGFVVDPLHDEEIARLQGAAENALTMSTEDLAHYVERGRKGAQRNLLTLQGIERQLAMRDAKVPAEDDSYLKTKSRDELAGLQLAAQLELRRYEDALRLATTALGLRRQ